MVKRALLFDFDGVIVDSFDAVLKINQHTEPALTAENYRERFEGSFGVTIKEQGKPTDVANFFEHYSAGLFAMPIVPGIKEVLLELAQFFDLAIISSSHTAHIKRFLDFHGLAACFGAVLGYDYEASKMIKIKDFLSERGCLPADALYITDTTGDIIEAKEAGVLAVAVSWGFHSIQTLERKKPSKLVNTPLELQRVVLSFWPN